MSSSLRQLGSSELQVSAIGFGCWPIAGVSTLETTDQDSLATIHRAIDCGVNFLDTAFSYGYDGESDRLLAQVLQERRQEVVLASKVGQYFNADRQRIVDGRPKTLVDHTEQTLQRLGVNDVDIMYLHIPDPHVDIAESAGAIQEIVRRGLARYAGVSNVTGSQLRAFHEECPVVVVQPPFNMLQQEAMLELRSTCQDLGIGIACYWALMKGLLAGYFKRDHQFDPMDKRLTYPIFQGEAWQRAQDFLDQLRAIASRHDCTVAQLVLAWTIAQPDVDVALCGAKRPEQIQETAQAMQLDLPTETLEELSELASENRA